MSEKEFWDMLYKKLCDGKDAFYAAEPGTVEYPEVEAYAEVAKEIAPFNRHRKPIKVGTTVRITLVSNMGDFCCSFDLDRKHGYDIRLTPGDGFLTNLREKR